jgi:hypothetical protein
MPEHLEGAGPPNAVESTTHWHVLPGFAVSFGTLLRYAYTFFTSTSLSAPGAYATIREQNFVPFFAVPVRSAVMNSASDQDPIPAVIDPVMFGPMEPPPVVPWQLEHFEENVACP